MAKRGNYGAFKRGKCEIKESMIVVFRTWHNMLCLFNLTKPTDNA